MKRPATHRQPFAVLFPAVLLSAAALLPVLALAAAWAMGLAIPLPYFGRGYVIRIALPEAGSAAQLPVIAGPDDPARPLVVIDAGHGGHDPGASGGDYQEKDLTLGLALALRSRILAGGGIRVALTRDDDRFLVLAERAEMARRLGADLFLSLHADSAGEKSAVNGASVYILSETASSEAAARFAARENNADRVNGLRVSGQSDTVASILVELSQRRARERSFELAQLILREGAGRVQFRPQPGRSAALVVLRAPDVPSALFEAGFITNRADAERLASPAGQARYADVLDRAIRVYFARQAGV